MLSRPSWLPLLSFLDAVDNPDGHSGTRVTQTVVVGGISVVITGTTAHDEVGIGWRLGTELGVRLDRGKTGLAVGISAGDAMSPSACVFPGAFVIENSGLVMGCMGWTIFAASSVVGSGSNGNELITTPSLTRSQMTCCDLKAILRVVGFDLDFVS